VARHFYISRAARVCAVAVHEKGLQRCNTKKIPHCRREPTYFRGLLAMHPIYPIIGGEEGDDPDSRCLLWGPFRMPGVAQNRSFRPPAWAMRHSSNTCHTSRFTSRFYVWHVVSVV